MGLRTGGRRAKSLKNRVKSSKIELRFREVRSEGRPPRSPVLQEISFRLARTPSPGGFLRGFSVACVHTYGNFTRRKNTRAVQLYRAGDFYYADTVPRQSTGNFLFVLHPEDVLYCRHQQNQGSQQPCAGVAEAHSRERCQRCRCIGRTAVDQRRQVCADQHP